MVLVVEGMSKPLHYDDIEPDAAALLASFMVGTELSENGFVSFLDEDGEDNLIPADKIMLLESVHYEDELDDEAPEKVKAKPAAKRKSARAAKRPAR